MDAEIKCPQCRVTFDKCFSDNPPSQDEEIEVTCPMCAAEISAVAYWSLNIIDEELVRQKAQG